MKLTTKVICAVSVLLVSGLLTIDVMANGPSNTQMGIKNQPWAKQFDTDYALRNPALLIWFPEFLWTQISAQEDYQEGGINFKPGNPDIALAAVYTNYSLGYTAYEFGTGLPAVYALLPENNIAIAGSYKMGSMSFGMIATMAKNRDDSSNMNKTALSLTPGFMMFLSEGSLVDCALSFTYWDLKDGALDARTDGAYDASIVTRYYTRLTSFTDISVILQGGMADQSTETISTSTGNKNKYVWVKTGISDTMHIGKATNLYFGAEFKYTGLERSADEADMFYVISFSGVEHNVTDKLTVRTGANSDLYRYYKDSAGKTVSGMNPEMSLGFTYKIGDFYVDMALNKTLFTKGFATPKEDATLLKEDAMSATFQISYIFDTAAMGNTAKEEAK